MSGYDPEFPQYARFAVVEDYGHTEQKTLRADFLTAKDAEGWIQRTVNDGERRGRGLAICGVRADGFLSLSL
jgi:hypothetical protein